MVNQWESTGGHCDIAYCLDRDWGCDRTAVTTGRTVM